MEKFSIVHLNYLMFETSQVKFTWKYGFPLRVSSMIIAPDPGSTAVVLSYMPVLFVNNFIWIYIFVIVMGYDLFRLFEIGVQNYIYDDRSLDEFGFFWLLT